MSRARHKKEGGSVKELPYNAQGSNVEAEAKGEKRKRGGKVHGEGEMAKKRHDRPGRKRGGSVMGSEFRPLSSAAKVKHITKDEEPEAGIPSD